MKYEEIHLFEHATMHALRAGLRKWFGRYNDWRPHEALGNLTPAKGSIKPQVGQPHDPGAANLGSLRFRPRTPLQLPKFESSPTQPLIHHP